MEPSKDSLESELLTLLLLQLVKIRLRQSRSTSRATQHSSSSQADKRETTAEDEDTAPPHGETGSKDESRSENTDHTKSGGKTEENVEGTSENTVPLQDEEKKNQTTSENNKETEINKEKCESKNINEEKTVETECEITTEIIPSPQDMKDEKETEAASKITTPLQDEIETEETEKPTSTLESDQDQDDNEVDKSKDELESQSTEHEERIIEEESQTNSEITVHSKNTKEQKETEENEDQSVSESTEHVETEEKQHRIISKVITLQDETGIVETKIQPTSENVHQGGTKIKDSKDELGSQSADETGNGKKSKKKKNQTNITQITLCPPNKNSQKETAKKGKETDEKKHETTSKVITPQGEIETKETENQTIFKNVASPQEYKQMKESKNELSSQSTDQIKNEERTTKKENLTSPEISVCLQNTKNEKETEKNQYESVPKNTDHTKKIKTEEEEYETTSEITPFLQDEVKIEKTENPTTSQNPVLPQDDKEIKETKGASGSRGTDLTAENKSQTISEITTCPQNIKDENKTEDNKVFASGNTDLVKKGKAEKEKHETIFKTVAFLQSERETGEKENKTIFKNIAPPKNKDTEENKDELESGTADCTGSKKENVEKESETSAEIVEDEKKTKEKKDTDHTKDEEKVVKKENQITPDTNDSESKNIDHIKNAEKIAPGEVLPASKLQSATSSIKVNVRADIFERIRSPIRDFPSFITLPPKSTTLGTKLLDSSKPITSKVYLPVDSPEFSALKRDQVPRKVLLLSASQHTISPTTEGPVPITDSPSFLLLSRELIFVKTELPGGGSALNKILATPLDSDSALETELLDSSSTLSKPSHTDSDPNSINKVDAESGTSREEVNVSEQELCSSNSPKNSSKVSFAPKRDYDIKPEKSSFPDKLFTEPVPKVPKVDNDQNVLSDRTGTFLEGDTSRKPSGKPLQLIDPSFALSNIWNLTFNTPPSAKLEEANTFHEFQSPDGSDQHSSTEFPLSTPSPHKLAAIKKLLPPIFTSNEVSRMLPDSDSKTGADAESHHSTVLEEASALAKVPVASEHQHSISHEEDSASSKELELQSTISRVEDDLCVKVDILSTGLSTEPAVMEEGLPHSSTLSEVSDLPLDSDSRISSPEDLLIQEEDELFSLSENSEPRTSSIVSGREESSESSLISEADINFNSSISVNVDNV